MKSTAERLKALPEFKALERVYAALAPLRPEGRRKVIEAIHALLEVSAGDSRPEGGNASRPRRKR